MSTSNAFEISSVLRGSGGYTATTVFLAAAVFLSLIAVGGMTAAASSQTIDSTDSLDQQIALDNSTTGGDFSVLDYATNRGNSANITAGAGPGSGPGLLGAVADWRNEEITTFELFEVVSFYRTGESLLEIEFSGQDSPQGQAVAVDRAVLNEDIEFGDDRFTDQFKIAIQNETGATLSTSDALNASEQSNVFVDGLGLDSSADDLSLTAAVLGIDKNNDEFVALAQGEQIEQTATVDPLVKGIFDFADPDDRELKATAGQNTTINVVLETATETTTNGTLTIDEQNGPFTESVEVSASQSGTLTESFELPTANLSAGDSFEYTVTIDNPRDSGSSISFDRNGVVQMQSLTFNEQAVGTSNGTDAVLVENVNATAGQTVRVTDNNGVVGSVTLNSSLDGGSVAVPVTTTAGDHTAELLTAGGDVVTDDSATVYTAALTINEQTYKQSTDTVVVNTSDLQPASASDYQVIIHNNTAGLPVLGNSTVVSGDQSDLTVTLDQEINSTTDVLAMLHFPDETSDFGSPVLSVSGSSLSPVTDDATVNVVEGSVSDLDAPATRERTEDITVSANITAEEKLGSNSQTDIDVEYVFDGTSVMTKTVTLGPGETQEVEFTYGIPGSTTAGDIEVQHGIEASNSGSGQFATLTVENPIQTAVDFAGSGDTVEVRDGTYTLSERVNNFPSNLKVKPVAGTNPTVEVGTTPVGFNVGADGVTIQGLTFERSLNDSQGSAIQVVDASNVTIQDNDIVLDNATATVSQFESAIIFFAINSGQQNVLVDNNSVEAASGASFSSTGDSGPYAIAAGSPGNTTFGNDVSITNNQIGADASSPLLRGISVNNLVGSLQVADNALYGLEERGVQVNAGVTDVTVTGNEFVGVGDVAVRFGGTNRNVAGTMSVTENQFTDIPGTGVELRDSALDPNVAFDIHRNNFDNVTAGVEFENLTAADPVVNATANWWGDSGGPSGEGYGLGASVDANVEFDPWLDAAYPGGDLVTDRNWSFSNLVGDQNAQRGETIRLNGTVENNLEPVGTTEGREVEAQYVLSESDGTTKILATKNITVVADGQQRVNFSAQLPQGPVDANAEHRIRVEDQFRGEDLNVTQNSVTVSGTVTASGDTAGTNAVPGDDPIENATVTIEPDDSRLGSTTVETDANGSYSASVPFGPATITVSKDEYETATRSTTVELGGITKDFALDYAEGGTLTGEITLDVVDPSEDVTVTVDADGTTTTVDINGTDNNGTYSLDLPVDVGDGYNVTANANNYEENTTTGVEVDVNTTTTQDIALSRETGTVEGAVVASGVTSSAVGAGEGIENATIDVYAFQDDAMGSATFNFTTDADGNFSETLPVGDHFVVVDKDNYTSTSQNVTVQADQTIDLGDVELDYAPNTGGQITGTVTLDPNDPGESVTVTISDDGGEFSTTVSLGTSNQTTYGFSADVNVDGYTVTYDADNYTAETRTVAVDVNETVQENVTLARETGTLNGTVTAAQSGFDPNDIAPGDGIENVTLDVYAFQSDDSGNATFTIADATDDTGEYAESLPVGTHHVVFDADGFALLGQTVTVTAGSTTTADSELVANAGNIEAQAELDVGAPENNFMVTYRLTGPEGDVDRTSTETLLANDSLVDQVTFEDAVPTEGNDTYTLTVMAQGYDNASAEVPLGPGENASVGPADLTLEAQPIDISADATLDLLPPEDQFFTYSLIGPDGNQIEDTEVLLDRSANGKDVPAVTFDTLDPINPNQNYTVEVSGADYETATNSTFVAPGGTGSVGALVLTRETGTLNGTVTASGDTNFSTANVPTGGAIDANVTVLPFGQQNYPGVGTPNMTADSSTGEYEFTGLPVGNHTIVVEAENFSSETRETTIESDNTTTEDFQLDYAQPGTVEGTVNLDFTDPAVDVDVALNLTDADTGAVVNDTVVTLTGTNDSKDYEFDPVAVNVDAGYTLNASATNYTDAGEGAFEVRVNETTTQNITLEIRRSSVTGTVTASGQTDFSTTNVPTGEPIEGAEVNLSLYTGDPATSPYAAPFNSTTTDASGEFRFENVPVTVETRHLLEVSAENFSDASDRVNVSVERAEQGVNISNADVVIALDTSGSIGGEIGDVKAGAKTLVNATGANYSLVEFTSTGTLQAPLGSDDQTVRDAIDDLTSGGGTSIADGINVSQQEIEANGTATTPDFIVLLSDGSSSRDPAIAGALDARNVSGINESGNGTQLISIAFGSSPDENLLEDVSSPPKADDSTINESDANAFIADQTDINAVFSDIGDVIDDEATVADFGLDYAQPGNVSGEVSLETPVDPDENVSVTVDVEETDNSTTIDINGSDSTGSYTIPNVPVNVDNDGNYTISANADNYLPNSTGPVNVTVNETTGDVDLTLERKTGSINGTVTASGDTDFSTTNVPTGEGIENVTVNVYAFTDSTAGSRLVSVTNATDENGSYQIDDVPVTSASNHTVEIADAANFSTPVNQTDVAVAENTTTTGVDFELDYAQPGNISGTISLEEPVDPDENVEVTVEIEETDNSTTTFINGSDTSGGYQIDDIPVNVDNDGNYTVTASADNYRDNSTDSVNVSVGETTTDVNLTLARQNGTLNVTLTADGDSFNSITPDSGHRIGPGDPIPNATVEVYTFQDDASGMPFLTGETDENGTFDPALPVTSVNDHYFEVVEVNGFRFPNIANDSVNITQGSTTTFTFELAANNTEIIADAFLDFGAPRDSFDIDYTLEIPGIPDQTGNTTVNNGTKDVNNVTFSTLPAIQPDQNFTLTVDAEGYDSDTNKTYVFPGDTEVLRPQLAAQNVALKSDGDVALLPGAPENTFQINRVLIGPNGTELRNTSIQAPKGETAPFDFSFDNRAPLEINDDEEYRVIVEAEEVAGTPGYSTFNESRYVAPGQTELLNVSLLGPVENNGTYYLTIQDAINDSNDGDTLDIREGTYVEDLTIPAGKDNLTLNGSGVGDTIVDGNVTVESNSDNHTIQDLTIQGNYTDNGNNNTLSNVDVTSSSPGGVVTLNGDDATLDTVTAELLEISGDDALVTSSEIDASTRGERYAALITGNRTTIDESKLTNALNETENRIPRVVTASGDSTEITDSTITGDHDGVDNIQNVPGYIQGVNLVDTTDALIDGVTFEGELDDAIQILRSNNVFVNNSEFDGTSTFDNQSVSVNFGGSDPAVPGGSVVVERSNFTSYGTPLYVNDETADANSVQFTQNNLEDAGGFAGVLAAVEAAAAASDINATRNWWGNATGPSGDPYQADGTGFEVSENVTFDPWLDDRVENSPNLISHPSDPNDVEVEFTSSTDTAQRQTQLSATVDVSNNVTQVGSLQDGRSVTVEFNVSGEVIDTETVDVIANDTVSVDLEGTVPNSTLAAPTDNRESIGQTVELSDSEGFLSDATAALNVSNPIQQAVNTADAIGASTVEVLPGTYNESVTVDVAGLTIEATGASPTVLPAADADGFTVTADGVTIDGLTVQATLSDGTNANPRPIDASGDSLTLTNSTIVGDHKNVTDSILDRPGFIQGVNLDDADDSTIDNVSFTGELGDAIQILRSDGVNVTESEFNGSTTNTDEGIAVNLGGSNPAVAGGNNLDVTRTNFTDYGTVLFVNDQSATGVSMNLTNIENAAGVDIGDFAAVEANATSANVDATYVWWGNATGPSGDPVGADGTGAEISENVTFDPWLGDRYETNPDVISHTPQDLRVEFDEANTENTSVRETTVNATVEIFNEVETVGTLADGRNVTIEYIVDGETINTTNVNVIADDSEVVELSGEVPASTLAAPDEDNKREAIGQTVDISDANGPLDSNNTELNVSNTIQQALDTAGTDGVAQALPGNYSENVEAQFTNQTLKAFDENNRPVLTPANDTLDTLTGTSNANKFTLSSFVITGGNDTGSVTGNTGVAVSGDNLTIESTEVTEHSIGVEPSSNLMVNGSTLSNNTFGIRDTTSGDRTIVEASTLSNNSQGIALYTGAHATINASTIANNSNYGARVASGPLSSLSVTYSNIENNGNVGVSVAADTDDVSVTRSNIVGNNNGGDWGIEESFTTPGLTVNGTLNWWGNATGPGGEPLKADGTGDNITENVTFDPWLNGPVGTNPNRTSHTDQDLRVEFVDSGTDDTAVREGSVSAEFEVFNEVEDLGSLQDGREVTVEYIIEGDVIVSGTVDVIANDSETISLTGAVPNSTLAAAPDNREEIEQEVNIGDSDPSTNPVDTNSTELNVSNPVQQAVDTADDLGQDAKALPGTYNASNPQASYPVNVPVDVTLEGPNAGTPYDGTRGDEANVTGQLTLNDGVVIDGLTLRNDGTRVVFINDGGAEVEVRNSNITDSSGSNQAFLVEYTSGDELTVANSSLTDGLAGVLVASQGNATIVDSELTGMVDTSSFSSGAGVKVAGGQAGGNVLAINRNDIENNDRGVLVEDPSGADVDADLTENNIAGNSLFGVQNNQSSNVNASLIWWGNETGPGGDPVGADGTGDNISQGVTFEPWLDDRIENSPNKTQHASPDLRVEFVDSGTDDTSQRETDATATAEVFNDVEDLGSLQGREVTVEYRIEGELVNSTTVDVIANDSKTVTLSGTVPNSTLAAPTDNRESITHELSINDSSSPQITDSNSTTLNVSNTIQQAINTAGDIGADKVEALPGNYTENVVANVSDLTVTAADPTAPPTLESDSSSEAAFNISADNVTLSEFEVSDNNMGVGLLVSNSTGTTLDSVDITDFETALKIAPGSSVTNLLVNDSTFADSNVGIEFDNTSSSSTAPIDATVQFSDIRNNSVAGVNVVQSGSGTEVAGITINNNNIVDNTVGIQNDPSASLPPELNAQNNWWGNENGPDEPGLPGEGEGGDNVSDRASTDFGLWLDAPAPDGQPVAGGRANTVQASGLTTDQTPGAGDPIENATVELYTYTDSIPARAPFADRETDDEGAFSFAVDTLPETLDETVVDNADNHLLVVNADNFTQKTLNVSVAEDDVINPQQAIELDYSSNTPGSVSGFVDLDVSDPAEDVKITLELEDLDNRNENDQTETVNITGSSTGPVAYEFSEVNVNVDNGYELTATANVSDYSTTDQYSFNVDINESISGQNFTFERDTGTVSVTTTAGDTVTSDSTAAPGESIENATVNVYFFQTTTAGSPNETLETDNTGAATFSDVPVGEHELEVDANNFTSQNVTITVSDGSTTTRDFTLDYSTIQASLNASNSNDVINLEAGTYNENVTFFDTAVENGVQLSGNGKDSTVIAGNVTIETGSSDHLLTDLTIEGNYTDNGSDNSLDSVNVTSSSPGGVVTLAGSGTAGNTEVKFLAAEKVLIEGDNYTIENDPILGNASVDNATIINGNNNELIGDGSAGQTNVTGNVTINGDGNLIQDLTIEGNYTDNGQNNSKNNVVVTNSSPGGTVILAGSGGTLTGVTAEEVLIEGDSYTIQQSNISNESTGPLLTVGSGVSGATIDNNEFTGGPDTAIYIRDDSGNLDLASIESDNNFDSPVSVGSSAIVSDPLPGGTVVNIDTGGLFNNIQPAVDNANANNRILVGPSNSAYQESVNIPVTGLTLEGPNAGIDGNDSASRGDEAVITGGSGNTPGLQITADGVTLDGLQVENTDTNGIRFGPNTVPSNVVIQNSVVTNVTGAIGGKSAGNGIQFQFGDVDGETAQNIQILDNEISNISTPDATNNEETIAIGVNVLPRGNNVSLEIRGNTFDDIEPGTSTNNRAEARGVSLSTQDDNLNGFGRVDGAVVTNNEFSNIAAGDNVRAVSLFEEDDLNPREGVKNFSVTRNNFTSLSGSSPQTTGAVFVGGYETLGADHIVTENNFDSGGVLRFNQTQTGFGPVQADDLNATENWWGDASGPSGAGPGTGNPVSENVTFDPWLNAPVPGGQPVTDGAFAVQNFQSSATSVQRGDTVSATADVTNGLQAASTNRDPGEVPLEYVLINATGGVEVLNSTSVMVTPGTTEAVTLSGTLSTQSLNALDNEQLTHRIRIAGEPATADSASIDVSHSIGAAINAASNGDTVTVFDGTYEESVVVDVPAVTVEPATGATPTVVGQSSVAVESTTPNVEITGLTIENPNGDRGIRAEDNATGVVIQNNTVTNVNTNNDADQARGIVVGGLDGGDSADGLEIRNNTVTNIEGADADKKQVMAIQILEQSNGGGLIENVVVDGNTIDDILDTRSTVAVNFNGNIEGEITNNDISGLNTEGNPNNVNPGGGFTQVIALNEGGDASSGPQNVSISGNEISNIENTTQENFAPPFHVIIGPTADGNTISITDNQFNADSPDTDVYLGDDTGDLNLGAVLNNSANMFDPSAVVAPADNQIVPESSVNVVNVDQRTGFDDIQPAVDAANSGNTLEVKTGTYNEEVTLDKPLTLAGSGSSAGGTVLQAPSSGSGNGITVDASDLTVRDLRVTNYSNGIRMINTHSNITFENVDSVGHSSRGMELRNSADLTDLALNTVNFSNNNRGIRGATTSSVDGLSIIDSEFSNNVQGIAIFQSESNPGQLNNVTILNTEFIDNDQKGIYTEKLSNATLDSVTIDGILNGTYGFNGGIDINLKYDNYENITIRDSTVANVSEGDPFNSDPSFSTAVAVKSRDDPSAYDTNPATLDNVTVDGVTIEDSFNGLRIGEPGVDYSAAPEGPTGVTITGSTFRNVSTDRYYVEDVPGDLDLNAVLNDPSNTFTPDAEISGSGDQIVPEIGAQVHRWRLDEDSGTTFNDSSGSVDASFASGSAEPSWEMGNYVGSNALNFDGTDDRASTDSGINVYNGTDFAIAFTMEVSNPGGDEVLLSSEGGANGPGFYLRTNDSALGQAGADPGNLTVRYGGDDDKVATDSISYDGSQKRVVVNINTSASGADAADMFINGSEVSTVVLDDLTFPDLSGDELVFGDYNGVGNPGYYGGILDDVKLFEEQLSQSEITEDFDRQPWSP